MRQRTRVVQRNLRMVLILVDGNATVADLSAKTGNVQLVENALHELEQSGFVELRVEQDSVWEQSKKVAAEIKAAAIGYTRPASAGADDAARITPSVPPATVFSRSQATDTLLSQFSVAPVHSASPASSTAARNISSFGIDGLSEPLSAQEPEERVKPPALLDRLKAFSAERKQKAADGDLSIKPIRRGGDDYYISGPIKVLFGVLGVLVLLLLTVFLFPYGSYLREAEAALAQASGQPAKVGEMRASFYPKPGLVLDNVRLGDATAGKEIRIAEMRLLPAVGSMMTARKVFHEATLSGVTLPAESLAGLSGIFASAAQPSAKASVQRVTLEKTDISFHGLGFSGLNGEIKLAPDGRFQSLSAHSSDRSVHLEARPAARGVDIELEGFAWRPLQASPLLLDSATLQGNLDGAELTLNKLELRAFDGLVQGVAVLRSGQQPGMAGEVSFERISARRFGEFLGLGPQFEGETSGKMKFSASADSWAGIFSAINANGEFSVRRGSLGNIDLAEAARRASATPTQGGATRFEQLSGIFSLTPSDVRLSGLSLTSGLMQSFGQVDVNRELQVSGRVEVQMSGTVNKLRVPLTLSGTLKAPLLQTGKR